jgi:hypothetical protein
MISAGFPISLTPKNAEGKYSPNTNYSYKFDFTTGSDCTGILLTYSNNTMTDYTGRSFFEIDISSLPSIPSYLCETRDGTLRKTHNYSDIIFNRIYGKSLNITGNVSGQYIIGSGIYLTSVNESLWNTNYSQFLTNQNYALNDSLWTLNYSTYLTKPTWTQATNGTILMRFQDWNATNTSYYLATNPFGFYNITTSPIYLNDTFFSNYSDYLTTKNYALNDSRWSLNYSDYLTSKNYALNDSLWSLNYSNFSTIYGYALNDSRWSLNYSNFLLSYNYATNDSFLLNSGDTATGNYTFDSGTLFIDSVSDRVGIGTTSPDEILDIERTSTTEAGGFRLANLQQGGYGNALRFYSTQATFGTDTVEAARIGVVGESNWASAAEVKSYMAFHTINSNVLGERMRITAAGNVGIGTTAPDTQLEIYKSISDTTNYASFKMATLRSGTEYDMTLAPYADDYSDVTAYQGTTVLQTYGNDIALSAFNTNDKIKFFAGDRTTPKMLINGANGNIGIGTTSPGAKLVVKGGNTNDLIVDNDGSQYTELDLAHDGVVKTSWYWDENNLISYFNVGSGKFSFIGGDVGINTASGNGRLSVRGAGTTTGYTFEAANSAGNTKFIVRDDGQIGFYGSDNAEKVRIDNAGNVGIGTTNPNRRLSVADGYLEVDAGIVGESDSGFLYLYPDYESSSYLKLDDGDGFSFMNGNVGIGTTAPTHQLEVVGNPSTYYPAMFSGYSSSKIPLYVYSDSGGSGIAPAESIRNLIYINPSGSTQFYGNSVPVMTILDGGNVGIGTTSPQNKLNVIGSLNITTNSTLGNLNANTITYFLSAPTFSPACDGTYNHSMISNASGWYICGVGGTWTNIG